jgi:thioredoxin 1
MKVKFPAIAAAVALALLIGLIGLIQHTRVTTPENITEITTQNFQTEVLKSATPVYIEFYVGQGCKACEAQEAVVEKLAAEYKGKVKFVRVDASKQPAIAQAAGITHVPTHFFLNPAEGVGNAVEGVMDEATFRQFLEDGLKLKKPVDNGNGGAGPTDPNGNTPADPSAEPKKDGK